MSEFLACCSFLGPLEDMPFDGNIVHLLAVLVVWFFSAGIAAKSGLLFSERPEHPRTSILQVVMQSAMNTLRMMDNLTDISTIRLVIVQVGSWYSSFLFERSDRSVELSPDLSRWTTSTM
jgi:hypothetical protein